MIQAGDWRAGSQAQSETARGVNGLSPGPALPQRNQAGWPCVQGRMTRVCLLLVAAVAGLPVLAGCGGQAGPRLAVTGILIRVGGPAGLSGPPSPLPLPGEVVARSTAGTQFTAVAGKDGRFRLSLPPGTYRLTGHSPQVAGELCTATRAVRVVMGRPLHTVQVICSIS